MSQTPNTSLPYILPSQAQKEVTHARALNRIDALLQLSVFDRDLTSPPASPAEGATYILRSNSTGEWLNRTNQIAVWCSGGWEYFIPREGWTAYVRDEDLMLVFTGLQWIELRPSIAASAFATVSIGASPSLVSSRGVSSVSYPSAGLLRVNFSANAATSTYAVSASSNDPAGVVSWHEKRQDSVTLAIPAGATTVDVVVFG